MSAPVIQIEPASQYQRCLCCLGPVRSTLVVGTSVPYATTQLPICQSCAAALLPLVDQISRNAASPSGNPDRFLCTCHTIVRPLSLGANLLQTALPFCTWCGGKKE